jgi:signal transduction histidine kinase
MQKEKLDLIVSVIAASLFVLLLAISVLFLFRIYLKRKNKLLLERERMNIEFEQTLLKSTLEIQESTLNNISREIHDNIGQVLSLVRINLNTLQPPGEEEKIERMDELMGKAITDLRSLSHSLDADHIREIGWLSPVSRLLSDLQKTGKYATHLRHDENLPPLGTDKPIILFRMIQESINNIIRHAAADTIRVDVIKDMSGIRISIADNGKGFDTAGKAEGVGLQNLKSRSKLINATLSINSKTGEGTTVIIDIKTDTNE